ncbi:HD domain-containing protein [uncultured Chitinophaga sp.]|jgi:Guanosine polyphosphate pyrophosphohydrolases/synthetases|uniref:HD domain-containing protein n=1 Tax=uncultured Chitinophaga sp. TaxID=339340 RepID=UPI002616A503|nr:HD domain-containing protein [uncultured Chitinophaga sp.]
METVLEQVKDFADKAHGEQTRKYTPDRYIVHPLRVMELVRQHHADIPMQAAALLHDVLEDTDVGKDAITGFLAQWMPPQQVNRTLLLVEELTDVYVKAKYPQWNRRKRKAKELERMERISADAQTIKYADILDNATCISEQDPDFARVFLAEGSALLKNMTKGNAALRQKATAIVQDALTRLNRRK